MNIKKYFKLRSNKIYQRNTRSVSFTFIESHEPNVIEYFEKQADLIKAHMGVPEHLI